MYRAVHSKEQLIAHRKGCYTLTLNVEHRTLNMEPAEGAESTMGLVCDYGKQVIHISNANDLLWETIMPRKARLDAYGTLHHVMERGIYIERSPIFRDNKDRIDFLRQLQGGSRTTPLPRIRSEIAHVLTEELGIPYSEIARQLGVSHVAVLKMMKKENRP